MLAVARLSRAALASLLYEIRSGTEPLILEELAYEEAQRRLSNRDLPDDATSLPCSLRYISVQVGVRSPESTCGPSLDAR